MVKVLNVAEKNDAAKSIAEVMSRGRFNRVWHDHEITLSVVDINYFQK